LAIDAFLSSYANSFQVNIPHVPTKFRPEGYKGAPQKGAELEKKLEEEQSTKGRKRRKS